MYEKDESCFDGWTPIQELCDVTDGKDITAEIISILAPLFENPNAPYPLLRKKRFMLDEMTQWNASKFAIFLEYENPPSIFRFSFHVNLCFSLMNALVYVNIRDRGIH